MKLRGLIISKTELPISTFVYLNVEIENEACSFISGNICFKFSVQYNFHVNDPNLLLVLWFFKILFSLRQFFIRTIVFNTFELLLKKHLCDMKAWLFHSCKHDLMMFSACWRRRVVWWAWQLGGGCGPPTSPWCCPAPGPPAQPPWEAPKVQHVTRYKSAVLCQNRTKIF